MMKKTAVLICLPFLCLCASIQADSNNPRVVIQTIFGDIAVELFPEDAPITVDNFLHYVNTGFYDFTVIHRTAAYNPPFSGFGISQGGGFYFSGGYMQFKSPDRGPIINESDNNLSNVRGTIAMARQNAPNSATSQFFFNQVDNSAVFDRASRPDEGYCVFGEVISGMNIIDFVTHLPHISDTNFTLGMTEVPYYHAASGYDYPVYIFETFVAPEGYWFRADINYDGVVNEQDLGTLGASWLGPTDLGDIEVVGNVDFGEFAQFARSWKRTSVWYRNFAGDIDNNEKVNFRDLSYLARDWGKNGVHLYGDLNLDGTVDYLDLGLFVEDWLKRVE